MAPLSSVEPSKGIQAVIVFGLDDGPVGLVLVRVGLAPARLLVERLVVPEPDGVDAEQAGAAVSAIGGVEGQRPDVGAVLPEVLALGEALLVARLLGQRSGCRAGCAGPRPRRRPLRTRRELVGVEQVRHHDEAVAPEVVDELRRAACAAGRHRCRSSPCTSRM